MSRMNLVYCFTLAWTTLCLAQSTSQPTPYVATLQIADEVFFTPSPDAFWYGIASLTNGGTTFGIPCRTELKYCTYYDSTSSSNLWFSASAGSTTYNLLSE